MPAGATSSTASTSIPGSSSTSTPGAASTRTPSATSATPGATATGTTRCATVNRRPTASWARWCSPTPCRRSSPASYSSPSPRNPRTTSTGWRASAPTTTGWSTGAASSPSAEPVSMLLYINEAPFYSQRPLVQFILSGIFERFPRLRFVVTESGCAWVPGLLERLDKVLARIRDTGATGEIRYGSEHVLDKSATEYFHQNVWMGVSHPGPADAEARHVIGLDKFMWGSDYPHDEGTYPFTREHLRALFHDTDPAELRRLLAGNVAELYGFDVDALAPLAAKFGPTVDEIATPLTELPDEPNEALLNSVGQWL